MLVTFFRVYLRLESGSLPCKPAYLIYHPKFVVSHNLRLRGKALAVWLDAPAPSMRVFWLAHWLQAPPPSAFSLVPRLASQQENNRQQQAAGRLEAHHEACSKSLRDRLFE